MLLLDSLAEEQILSAMRRGDLDNLSGQGRPLQLEDDSAVPEELRVAYRLLRNAGCLPPELSLRNEISEVEALLNQARVECEQHVLRRRLRLLQARLALHGRETSLLVRDMGYREKLIDRMAPAGQQGTREKGSEQT